MIAIFQFRPAGEPGGFAEQAESALSVLAARPGFVRGSLGRSTDDEQAWVLLTEWESVGAYRRGLGAYDVKLTATPVLSQALDVPSAFETLVRIDEQGTVIRTASDRASADRPVG
jgi:hypothetical protein